MVVQVVVHVRMGGNPVHMVLIVIGGLQAALAFITRLLEEAGQVE
jgi:hypothetical protein